LLFSLLSRQDSDDGSFRNPNVNQNLLTVADWNAADLKHRANEAEFDPGTSSEEDESNATHPSNHSAHQFSSTSNSSAIPSDPPLLSPLAIGGGFSDKEGKVQGGASDLQSELEAELESKLRLT
jgi:hypothetical protein